MDFLLLLSALDVAFAQAPALLVEVGEVLPGAVVARVETHPEYLRVWLRYPNGALVPAEITTSTEGNEGLCAGGGAALYPRDDLAEGPRPADTVAPMLALCTRLAAHPPALRARGATGDIPAAGEAARPPLPPPSTASVPGWGTFLLGGVVAAFAAAFAWRTRRPRPVRLS